MTPDQTIAWLEGFAKMSPSSPAKDIRDWIAGEVTAGLSFSSTEELFDELARRMETSCFIAQDKTGTMIRLEKGSPPVLYGLTALAATSYMNDVALWTRKPK